MISGNLGGKAFRVCHWVGWGFFGGQASVCSPRRALGCAGDRGAPGSSPASPELPEEPWHGALVCSVPAKPLLPRGAASAPAKGQTKARPATAARQDDATGCGRQGFTSPLPLQTRFAASSPARFPVTFLRRGGRFAASFLSPRSPRCSSPALRPPATARVSKGTQHPLVASASFFWLPDLGLSSEKSALGS